MYNYYYSVVDCIVLKYNLCVIPPDSISNASPPFLYALRSKKYFPTAVPNHLIPVQFKNDVFLPHTMKLPLKW